MPKKLLFLVVLAELLLLNLPAFSQSVDTAWVRRYNGPGNSTDQAHAIAVDGSGNVYVTGQSYGSGTSADYATIKYYPSGDTAWVRRYNGPGNYVDIAFAIEVDSSGLVYVTGNSYGSGTSADYATIKYYPNGDTVWVRRYAGPQGSDDQASAIAVDGSGNVYVTGTGVDSATWYDYVTIKYYSNGDTAWVRRYNGRGNGYDVASAISVDGSGNVYVTGYSVGSGNYLDYATIKYYPNGDTAWVRRYHGPEILDDKAYAIAVDGSGNAYVTGSSGGWQWCDYATIKYYPNGDTAWVRRYNGLADSADEAYSIAVDAFGNVYVTGSSYGSGTNADYATIKYYPNGDTAWVRRFNGRANLNDNPSSIALDDSGNVYITGGSAQSGAPPYSDYDYLTIKYHPNGDSAWVKSYSDVIGYPEYANAIALDNSGNVYVTGYRRGPGISYYDDDYATIKYVQFLRGDANHDTKVTVADIVFLVSYLFKRGPQPYPILQVGDANCDGKVTVSDVVYLINYLFKRGPQPCI